MKTQSKGQSCDAIFSALCFRLRESPHSLTIILLSLSCRSIHVAYRQEISHLLQPFTSLICPMMHTHLPSDEPTAFRIAEKYFKSRTTPLDPRRRKKLLKLGHPIGLPDLTHRGVLDLSRGRWTTSDQGLDSDLLAEGSGRRMETEIGKDSERDEVFAAGWILDQDRFGGRETEVRQIRLVGRAERDGSLAPERIGYIVGDGKSFSSQDYLVLHSQVSPSLAIYRPRTLPKILFPINTIVSPQLFSIRIHASSKSSQSLHTLLSPYSKRPRLTIRDVLEGYPNTHTHTHLPPLRLNIKFIQRRFNHLFFFVNRQNETRANL